MATGHRSRVKDPAKAFISTWRTSTVYTGSTANNQIKLPLQSTGTYRFTVQWGDGTSNLITTWNQAETTHTYPTPGDYTVTITGFIRGWDWGGGGSVAPVTGDMRKLLTVTQFGCLRFVTNPINISPIPVWGAFYGCTNLNLTAVQDMPNFKGCTSMIGFLRGYTLATVNNVNKWDTSKIEVFRNVFRDCVNFNDNIGNWNVGKGTTFVAMFLASASAAIGGKFNNGGSSSIGNWDTSSATDMSNMFQYQPLFNQNIGNWNVSNVTGMASMFYGVSVAPYGTFDNGGSNSINNWNTGNVTSMSTMFVYQPNFNRNIGSWNTSKVTLMSFMFFASPVDATPGLFNQDISNWDTSNVTNMTQMFYRQPYFNQEIGKWNVGKVTDMSFMLRSLYTPSVGVPTGTFNNAGSPSINNWNTANVTTMNSMFSKQDAFNQNIGGWNTSKVNNMSYMLQSLGFNNGGSPDINNWDTSKVTTMSRMFQSAFNFNQPLNNWDIPLVTDMLNFMAEAGITTPYAFTKQNYSNLLIALAAQPVKPNVPLRVYQYYDSTAVAARAILTSAPNNWTFVDRGLQP
jgi:surface protein